MKTKTTRAVLGCHGLRVSWFVWLGSNNFSSEPLCGTWIVGLTLFKPGKMRVDLLSSFLWKLMTSRQPFNYG